MQSMYMLVSPWETPFRIVGTQNVVHGPIASASLVRDGTD